MQSLPTGREFFILYGHILAVYAVTFVADTLDEGWDIVAVDSFHELQGVIKEEENITNK